LTARHLLSFCQFQLKFSLSYAALKQNWARFESEFLKNGADLALASLDKQSKNW